MLISTFSYATKIICPIKTQKNEVLTINTVPEISSNFGMCRFIKKNRINCRIGGEKFRINLSSGRSRDDKIIFPMRRIAAKPDPRSYLCQLSVKRVDSSAFLSSLQNENIINL